MLVVDEMAGTQTVGGNKDHGVQPGPEQIDRDDRRSLRLAAGSKRLADHHLASLERGMTMAANGAADYLGGNHGWESTKS